MKLQKNQLWVSLNSCSNPSKIEFGSRAAAYTEINKDIENVFYAVDSLEAASDLCRRYIEHFDLGSGNWIGGMIVDDAGHSVGRISYNGRIWLNDTN